MSARHTEKPILKKRAKRLFKLKKNHSCFEIISV